MIWNGRSWMECDDKPATETYRREEEKKQQQSKDKNVLSAFLGNSVIRAYMLAIWTCDKAIYSQIRKSEQKHTHTHTKEQAAEKRSPKGIVWNEISDNKLIRGSPHAHKAAQRHPTKNKRRKKKLRASATHKRYFSFAGQEEKSATSASAA